MVFVAKESEIPDWGKKVVEVEGQEIMLIRAKGSVWACESECPHQGAPLHAALVKEAGRISCPRHGFRFDLASGACEGHPELTLKVYPVEIREGDVYVAL